MENNTNPCSYKKACKLCKMVAEENRPSMCQAMQCEHYTPCKKCHQNRSVGDNEICVYCDRRIIHKEQRDVDLRESLQMDREDKIAQGLRGDSEESLDEVEAGTKVQPVKRKRRSDITPPGEPPAALSEEAQEYYRKQWAEYYGYFSDPTAMTLVHHLILEEIRLNRVSNILMVSSSADKEPYEKEKQRCLDNIKNIRTQLPQRDAKEISDYEDFMSKVADRYAEEKGSMDHGPVSRIFEPEAFVLANNLHYRMDPREILEKAGYQPIDIEEAIARLEMIPEDPLELLEFLGYPVRERYALDKN